MPYRFVLARVLVVAAVAGLAFGCGRGAATGDLDQIKVEVGRSEIFVTNLSGRALLDVVAEIEPPEPSSHFVTRVPRLESGQKRMLSHGSFNDRDSVSFSPRNAKARRITITAQDINGKVVRVSVPYK